MILLPYSRQALHSYLLDWVCKFGYELLGKNGEMHISGPNFQISLAHRKELDNMYIWLIPKMVFGTHFEKCCLKVLQPEVH